MTKPEEFYQGPLTVMIGSGFMLSLFISLATGREGFCSCLKCPFLFLFFLCQQTPKLLLGSARVILPACSLTSVSSLHPSSCGGSEACFSMFMAVCSDWHDSTDRCVLLSAVSPARLGAPKLREHASLLPPRRACPSCLASCRFHLDSPASSPLKFFECLKCPHSLSAGLLRAVCIVKAHCLLSLPS